MTDHAIDTTTTVDGTDFLCQALYGRKAEPKDYMGGSNAKMLFDAATMLNGLIALRCTANRAATVPSDTLSDDDLAPCPFCGGEAEKIDFDGVEGDPNAGGSCISCKKCGASSPVHFDRKENLYSSWNERKSPDSGEIERLSERCLAYKGQVEAGSIAIQHLQGEIDRLRASPVNGGITKDEFNFLVELFNRRSHHDVIGIPYAEHAALGRAIDLLRPTLPSGYPKEGQR